MNKINPFPETEIMHRISQRKKTSSLLKLFLGGFLLILNACSPSEPVAKKDFLKNLNEPVLTPQKVNVNRKKPDVIPASSELKFSDSPTDVEISRAHVLPDGLVPSGKTSPADNQALVAALLEVRKGGPGRDLTVLERFVREHPNSAWNVSLQLNLGLHAYESGYFSKAFAFWEEGWKQGKSLKDQAIRAQVDRTFGELVRMHARIGNIERLKELFAELGDRSLIGSATELVANSKEGLWMMEHEPGVSFLCGPLAVGSVYRFLKAPAPLPKAVRNCVSTPRGFSLKHIKSVTHKLKMNYQMALWKDPSKGAFPPLPAVVHWKVGHYAALIREEKGQWLVRDSTFGRDLWISGDALRNEASGYFLIPSGVLPEGWSLVSDKEGDAIFGKGNTTQKDSTSLTDEDEETPLSPSSCPVPMAQANAFLMLVSLHIQDTPVRYTPPKGPSVNFRVSYNQREEHQPSSFNYSNLGVKWTFEWLSYVVDTPTFAYAPVEIFGQGGGTYPFKDFDGVSQTFAPQVKTQGVLKRTSTTSYEYSLKDGSKQIFGLSDGSTVAGRRVYLTQIIDPAGNSVSYTYDSLFRLVAVTDSLGQVTTLEYNHPTDSLKITKVIDPFGREASFEYDGSGRLNKITDVIGITSEFTYGTDDFITSMTTPYGTEFYEAGSASTTRWLNIKDTQGDVSRIEYRHNAPGIPASYPNPPADSGLTNDYFQFRNSFYWDKKAWKLYPGDYSKAVITHFLHMSDNPYATSGIVESIKKPLEDMVYYRYFHQATSYDAGDTNQPIKIERNIGAGSPLVYTLQLSQFTYNIFGKLTNSIDPLGRETLYTFATNNIDLLSIRQKTGGIDELLASATYNSQHLPLTVTDAAGQTTTMTYNSAGQLTTVLNAKSELTTLNYDSNGYLLEIDGPVSGAGDKISFTYDGFGRIRTVTDSEGYVQTYDYDVLDRPTKITYPDATYEQFVYNRLDNEWVRDREGRWTHHFYNAIRQKVATQDALGRTVNLEWCKCGALQGLTDALGRITKWTYDVQGRLTEKTYPDGTKDIYTYEPTISRLKSMVDAKSQRTNYEYFVDNRLKKVSYTDLSGNPLSPVTPAVEWAYDASYGRLSTMTDGQGVTAYSYYPITLTPALGAGQLASINGPLSGTTDLIEFTYDQLGRVLQRSVDTVAQTQQYDNLGRVTQVANPLGTFVYHYLNYTGRVSSIDLPNGQKTLFNYFNNVGDQRLEEIKNLDAQPTPAMISKFNYTYAPAGDILTWTQDHSGTGGVPVRSEYRYDAVDQLREATLKNATSGALLKAYVYGYDKAGNRTSEQIDMAVVSATNNNLNQVTATAAGGPLQFSGTVNKPSTVTVGGQAAEVDAANNFRGSVTKATGTSTVAIVATDPNGNVKTQNYQVTVPTATARTLTYDLNGNMTNDGNGKVYAWDAANRLVKITYGSTGSTEFTYDGLSRRVKIVEKNGAGTVTSDKRLLWSGLEIIEERNSSNTVLKRFYGQGVQVPAATAPANNLFYTRDHLGSVRELTDNNAVVRGRWNFDSYGRRSANLITSSALETDFAYTGHYFHSRSNLNAALFRLYDADLDKWLSRDPIAEKGGVNLYGYVGNNPIKFTDRLGLDYGGSLGEFQFDFWSGDGDTNVGTLQQGAFQAATDTITANVAAGLAALGLTGATEAPAVAAAAQVAFYRCTTAAAANPDAALAVGVVAVEQATGQSLPPPNPGEGPYQMAAFFVSNVISQIRALF